MIEASSQASSCNSSQLAKGAWGAKATFNSSLAGIATWAGKVVLEASEILLSALITGKVPAACCLTSSAGRLTITDGDCLRQPVKNNNKIKMTTILYGTRQYY